MEALIYLGKAQLEYWTMSIGRSWVVSETVSAAISSEQERALVAL